MVSGDVDNSDGDIVQKTQPSHVFLWFMLSSEVCCT